MISEDTDFEVMSTGAKRNRDDEREAYWLLSPIGLRRIAETAQVGLRRYGAYNWEKGMPVHRLLNRALRHIFQYLSGDRTEDHLGHAAWNLLAACHSEELWPELNTNILRQPGCKPPIS